ncbi:hypothetical protein ABZ686_21000 [Streptomyces sp. NPDC006992]|uniref:hypothetical protein n=1 Tax=Streptomyces sp. NPDC006992 TaxID=3155601 RepID=UPI0033FBBF33
MNKIKAQWRPAASLPGELVYSLSEYGFRFRTSDAKGLLSGESNDGFASVSVDTLQIEVSVQTGRALYVWGYDPYTGWRGENVSAPEPQPGLVILHPREPFEDGISVSIPAQQWDRRFDQSTGWFAASPHDGDDAQWHVEIATGIVLGGSTEGIRSIYLRPTFED